jgi:hypothetical protein
LVTDVVVEFGVVVGQHSPSEQHDDFAAVLVLALAVEARQSGGHAGEQPGGQVGSSQQSTAFVPATFTSVTLARVRQSGEQASEQPGGQVGSRQQS